MRRVALTALLLGTVLMAGRLYNFRFPFDARTTFEPLREQLSGDSLLTPGSGDYETVMAYLADRDRAIEDHLNYVSQGRLGYVTTETGTQTTDGDEHDITALTVTVTIPANRVLRVTGQARFWNSDPGGGVGYINEDGVNVGRFGEMFCNAAAGSSPHMSIVQSGSVILTPAAGTHTYDLSMQRLTGVGSFEVGGAVGFKAFLLVEDIGPAGV